MKKKKKKKTFHARLQYLTIPLFYFFYFLLLFHRAINTRCDRPQPTPARTMENQLGHSLIRMVRYWTDFLEILVAFVLFAITLQYFVNFRNKWRQIHSRTNPLRDILTKELIYIKISIFRCSSYKILLQSDTPRSFFYQNTGSFIFK